MQIELRKPMQWRSGDMYMIRVDEQLRDIATSISQVHGRMGGFGTRPLGLSYFSWTRTSGFGLDAMVNTKFGHAGAGPFWHGLAFTNSADVTTRLEVHRNGVGNTHWPDELLQVRVKPKWGKRFIQRAELLEVQT